jgi:hypothetical protein
MTLLSRRARFDFANPFAPGVVPDHYSGPRACRIHLAPQRHPRTDGATISGRIPSAGRPIGRPRRPIARQPLSILPIVEQGDTARRLYEIDINTDDVAGLVENPTKAVSSGAADHPVSAAFPSADSKCRFSKCRFSKCRRHASSGNRLGKAMTDKFRMHGGSYHECQSVVTAED